VTEWRSSSPFKKKKKTSFLFHETLTVTEPQYVWRYPTVLSVTKATNCETEELRWSAVKPSFPAVHEKKDGSHGRHVSHSDSVGSVWTCFLWYILLSRTGYISHHRAQSQCLFPGVLHYLKWVMTLYHNRATHIFIKWPLTEVKMQHSPPVLSRSKECEHLHRTEFFLLWPWQLAPLNNGTDLPKHGAPAQTFDFLQGNNINANSLSLPNTRFIVRNF
jgi:hypothetical protein